MPFDSLKVIAARLAQPLGLALAVALAWLLLESLLFRTDFYYVWLAEPDSNAGAVTMRLERARREATATRPTVLVFGDSRVGEGFSEPVAGAAAPELAFVNVGVPGSTPRTWFYLLREMRRRGVPFGAVVVGVPYRHLGGGELADWPLDAAFMAPLVGLGDARSFPAGFPSAEMRRRAAATVWMPALTMQKDVQGLLASPRERWKNLKRKRWWVGNAGNYPGRDERMPALEFSAKRRVLDWKDATARQKGEMAQHLEMLSQTPEPSNDAYLGLWLGRLLALAREAGVPMIVYPYPRGPYPGILPKDEGLPPSLLSLAQESGVTVLPADFLGVLESPDYFFDALHANREGRRITSEAVARAVDDVLGKDALGKDAPGRREAQR